MKKSDAILHLEKTSWLGSLHAYLGSPAIIDDTRTEQYLWGYVFVFVPHQPEFSKREFAKLAVSSIDGRIAPAEERGISGVLQTFGIEPTDENLTPITSE